MSVRYKKTKKSFIAKEINRFAKSKDIVSKAFFDFGINKSQEILRLIYEVSKIKDISPTSVFQSILDSVKDKTDFSQIKRYLLKQRYPQALLYQNANRFYLSKLSLNRQDVANLTKRRFYPLKIYYEREVSNTHIFRQFKDFFSRSRFIEIETFKRFVSERRYTLKDYNERRDNIFLVCHTVDFFKDCPCTKGAVCCGYKILNIGFGCIFECVYCYLQEYTNAPGIVLPVNLNNFFDTLKRAITNPYLRIGTGEFTDSLMLDHITGYSLYLVDYFKKAKKAILELKTKSDNIKRLMSIKGDLSNIVISWSINPQDIIEDNEYFTSSLKDRLSSARLCADTGYKVGFHLDPIIYIEGWSKLYKGMLDRLFENIDEKDIAWISLGTLRFNPKTKDIIEKRFPQNRILDAELIQGFDSKLRYPSPIAYKIYKELLGYIRKRYRFVRLYLCMESQSLWSSLREFRLDPFLK